MSVHFQYLHSLLLTSLAVLSEDLPELELHQLQCLPQWVAVQNATIPPSPPPSPLSSGMGDDNIGGGEAAPASSAFEGTQSVMPGGDIPRLRPRKPVVIIDSTTSSSDSSIMEDEQRQPSERISSANVSSAPGVYYFTALQSALPHTLAVRRTVRMQCTPLRALEHSSSSSDDDAPLLKARVSSQKHAIKKEKQKRATVSNKRRIETAAIEGLHDLLLHPLLLCSPLPLPSTCSLFQVYTSCCCLRCFVLLLPA